MDEPLEPRAGGGVGEGDVRDRAPVGGAEQALQGGADLGVVERGACEAVAVGDDAAERCELARDGGLAGTGGAGEAEEGDVIRPGRQHDQTEF